MLKLDKMKKLTGRTREKARSALRSIIAKVIKGQAAFNPEAYYLTFSPSGDFKQGVVVLSMKPYRYWSAARSAAKKMHSRAFIARGRTLNNYFRLNKA